MSSEDEYEVNSDNKALQDTAWMIESSCVFFPEINFYSSKHEEIKLAKQVCATCPVKAQCAQFALDHNERYGVWAGADQAELRQVLSVDHDGALLVHKKPIFCIICRTKKYMEVTQRRRTKTKIRCSKCGLEWFTRRLIGRRNVTW